MGNYIQTYSNFLGLDASSGPRDVARNRLAYSVNMWRDYESETGTAIETIPGFRRVLAQTHIRHKAERHLNGLHHWRTSSGTDYIVVNIGGGIKVFPINDIIHGGEQTYSASKHDETVKVEYDVSFTFNNVLYLNNGAYFYSIKEEEDKTISYRHVENIAYIPTTYFNGEPFEQRNMLTDTAIQIETAGGVTGGALGVIIKKEIEKKVSTINFPFYSKLCKNYLEEIKSANEIVINSVEIDKQTLTDITSTRTADPADKDNKWYILNKERGWISLAESWKDGTGDLVINVTLKFPDKEEKEVEITFQRAEKSEEETTQDIIFVQNDYTYEYVYMIDFHIYEKISGVNSVFLGEDQLTQKTDENMFMDNYLWYTWSDNKIAIPERALFRDGKTTPKKVTITVKLEPLEFQTVGTLKDFKKSTGYTKTGYEAIAGCTRSAVYDGRVFLTGNPDLPNTVFYSQRNLTGANDPTYFGVYNYFNDGEGNVPNVELLALPSMLMVIKRNTVQDGSIYYHVGTDNTDEDTKHLLPRIYPSTQGAAGLGSASKIGYAGGLCCNFLDDPVFLSERGLEAVGKQTVNLERTITHRSSNIDKMLMRENLYNASICEWKGYLVICVEGHIYLADSRTMTQHADGSYQYEWFYLEGIGTYESYDDCYTVCSSWPKVDIDKTSSPVSLSGFLLPGRVQVAKEFRVDNEHTYKGRAFGNTDVVSANVVGKGNHNILMYYVKLNDNKYIVERSRDGEKVGIGEFSPAVKVMCVDDMLFFATASGDICVFNTDKRGVSVDTRAVDPDKIDTYFYTFNGIRYTSGCSTKLDDCDKSIFAKSTVCGTTLLRMKMMPGSHCFVNASEDGRVWKQIGEISSSRFDFANFDMSSFSFTEDQGHDAVIPEISRRWYNKQYYVYSDGYMQPFGLYELSYMYRICGKIRY